MKRATLRVEGHSEISETKRNIQALLREIVIKRDGGCIFRQLPAFSEVAPLCNGFNKSGDLILQADHLITRSNSATYADSRLVVCVCKGHHAWKSLGSNLRKKEYDELVRTLLPADRVALWDACERDSWRPRRTGAMDWKLAEVALCAQLAGMEKTHATVSEGMRRWHKAAIGLAVAASAIGGATYLAAHQRLGPPDIYPPADVTGVINPDVTQATIQQTICVKGWTATIRPAASYTTALKIKQLAQYGSSDQNPADYEEDHLISLELGGNPTSPENLWPEPNTASIADGGAKNKDQVENYLHAQVCGGAITLLKRKRK